jgi:hypothetical protein
MSVLSRLIILLGGFYVQFGSLFVAFGMIFVLIFIPNSEVMTLMDNAKWEEVQGTVLGVENTNSSVNDSPVRKYFYQYAVDGVDYEGAAFSHEHFYLADSPVLVEYQTDNPSDSRIKGMRQHVFDAWVIFTAVFPFIGLIFMFIGIMQNAQALRLLQYGEFARGKLSSKMATNTKINNNPVFKYVFDFKVQEQAYQAIGKTHHYGLLEDEETERIIYNPANPSDAVLYDTIPLAPAIDPEGFLEPVPMGRAVILILPILAILMVGALFWIPTLF